VAPIRFWAGALAYSTPMLVIYFVLNRYVGLEKLFLFEWHPGAVAILFLFGLALWQRFVSDDLRQDIIRWTTLYPSQVKEMGERIGNSDIQPQSVEVESELRQAFLGRQIPYDDSWFVSDRQLREKWTRCSYLFFNLLKASRQRTFARFFEDTDQDLALARSRYDEVSTKLARLIVLFDRLERVAKGSIEQAQKAGTGLPEEVGVLLHAREELIQSTAEDVNFYFRFICAYAARFALAASWSVTGAPERLRTLGVARESGHFGWKNTLMIVLILLAAMIAQTVLGAYVMSSEKFNEGLHSSILYVPMVIIIQLVAIALGVWKNEISALQLRYRGRGWDYWLRLTVAFGPAAIAALIAAFVINFVWFGIWVEKTGDIFVFIKRGLPYQLLAPATTIVVMILSNDDVYATVLPAWRRRVKVAGAMGITVGCAMLAAGLFRKTGVFHSWGIEGEDLNVLIERSFIAAVMGGLLGYLVVWPVRGDAQKSASLQESAPSATINAPAAG
jgi:hypothetical protein